MEKTVLSHPLFFVISSEHRQFEKKLSDINISMDFAILIDWLWEFIEIRHHQKEEHILFQFIKNNPRICEGGPLCTLFFDYHMNAPPLEKAKKLTGSDAEIESHQLISMVENSPLKIPLSEHVAGKQILRYCIKNQSVLSRSEIFNLLIEYKKIQIDHMTKEETCFFHLCANLIKPSDADQLYLQWISE